MDKAVTVSIVIPSYNSKATLKECVYSIDKSSFKEVEIIVVDDCSTDGSYEFANSFTDLSSPFKVVRQSENMGPAAARNSGAKLAQGKYLFFLDSDTVVFDETIKTAVQEIEQLKGDAVTGVYHWSALNKGLVPEYKALFNYYFFSKRGIILYEVFDSSRACIKKEVFDRLGGFNEQLKWGMDYENEEFGYRLCIDHRNYLVPSIQVRHHFPVFKKLTKTYFSRVSLWMEIFADRQKFESGGITSSGMGFGTASILPALLFLPFLSNSFLFWIPVLFFAIYFKTYLGFYWLSLKKRGFLKGVLLVCVNIYFSLVISLGAGYGFIVFALRKVIKKK